MITDNTDTQHPGGETGSIAAGTAANEALMDRFFRQVSIGANMVVDVKKVTGRATRPNPFNCENIVHEIKALPVNPGDAVMVYYAGHGLNIGTSDALTTEATIAAVAPPEFRDRPPTQFPFLACGTQITGSPNLDMIAAWLAPKQPRLTVVMADACNSFYGGSGPPAENFFAASAAVTGPERRLRSLFREARGTVLASGSQRGHYSYYSANPANQKVKLGGLFTLQFMDLFDSNVLPQDSSSTWQDIGSKFKPMSVDVAGGGHDVQMPLLKVGNPFSTAVKMPQEAVLAPDSLLEVAQALQFAPLARLLDKVEQVAPGTNTGPKLGPLPPPRPPLTGSGLPPDIRNRFDRSENDLGTIGPSGVRQ